MKKPWTTPSLILVDGNIKSAAGTIYFPEFIVNATNGGTCNFPCVTTNGGNAAVAPTSVFTTPFFYYTPDASVTSLAVCNLALTACS
jgi:hypothetical protein